MDDLTKNLRGYRLTTAEILYHMPDHPQLLQTFVWQELDLPPQYPRLLAFVHFWVDSIDGRIHSVRVATRDTLCPSQILTPDFFGTVGV